MWGMRSNRESQGSVRDQLYGLGQWLIAGVATAAIALVIMGIIKAFGG